MQDVIQLNILMHIVAGSSALAAGTIALCSKKGGKAHRWSGWVFYVSILFVMLSSTATELYHNRRFLLIVGLFSFYLNFTGVEALQRRTARYLDWAMAILHCILGLGFLVELVFKGNFMVLPWAAGLALTWFAVEDIYHYRYKQQGDLGKHIGRMMGAYISVVTAVLVVNIESAPVWLWFLPTVLMVPLLIYFLRRYRVAS